MTPGKLTRRQALEAAGTLLAGERGGAGIEPASEPAATPAPLEELVNCLEFEEQAKLALPPELFSTIAGSDRSAFDRLTFRPRMNVPTLDMDLSVSLFGENLFTPIVVGPISDRGRYHADGELATLAGAAAARTVAIVSEHTSVELERVARAATPFWYSVYADDNAHERAQTAVAAGAKVLFITVGARYDATMRTPVAASANPKIDWSLVDAIRDRVAVPVVLKGVMSPAEATTASEHGLDGVVVSNFGGLAGGSTTAPIDQLIAVVDAVSGELPVLVDGSFRRATDLLDALILGARGVLLGRPVMWALSAYGAEGVRTLLQMLQRDLARCFAMLGASNLQALSRRHLKIHER